MYSYARKSIRCEQNRDTSSPAQTGIIGLYYDAKTIDHAIGQKMDKELDSQLDDAIQKDKRALDALISMKTINDAK